MSNHHSFVSKLLCAVLSVVMMISLIPATAGAANGFSVAIKTFAIILESL